MAFVNFTFEGVERGLPEDDALAVAEELRRRGALRPVARVLAERVEEQARGGTFAKPPEDVEVDDAEQKELSDVLDGFDADGRLTQHLRALQMGIRGERRPGEPGYRS